MSFDFSRLRGRIVEKYGTQTAFAEKLGVSKQIINRKLSGDIRFTPDDITAWSETLEISSDLIGPYFFTSEV